MDAASPSLAVPPDSPEPEVETKSEVEPKPESASQRDDQYGDAMECSDKDEASDGSSVASEVIQTSQIKTEVAGDESESSETPRASPLKADLSSDESPAKSAISGDSPNQPVKDEIDDIPDDTGAADTEETSELPRDVAEAAPAGQSVPVSAERLRAAAEVIGKCGQSSSRRRTTPQPRDFSRERPAGVRHIRLVLKTKRKRRPPTPKEADPKHQRRHSPDLSK